MTGSHLRELARLYGIQLSYEDASKKKRNAPRESLEAILRARLGTVNREALDARREQLEKRVVEPVTAVFGRQAIRVRVNLTGSVSYEIELETRDRFAGHLDVIDGSITIPHKLPVGYHRLRVNDAHESMLFVAPMRAPAPKNPRSWGIFLPLYAAQHERSWGVGDLGTLQAYRSWLNELRGGIVATLPLLAAFEDEPSPYSPVSRLFWNELYLDVERLPEYDASDRDEADIAFLRHAPSIDYARAHRMKRRALLRMSERFQPDDNFETFAFKAGAYAEFRAHCERERRTTIHELPVGTHRYHLYVQYRMAQQMRTVADDARKHGLGLYLDFPLGVNPGGYDAWRYKEHFAKGVSVGAPPDLFFTKGQNWGFPPLDPEAAREHHYDYFRECIRHHVEHAGVLRIDHVMGLHRLFWIPEGGEAKDGVYVRYNDEELYAALLIEASRTNTVIVGEDLGTVPQAVPAMMAKHGLRRMYVVQYEQKLDPPPLRESVASVNTHDMPTFAGFWRGKDIDDRVAMGLLDERGAAGERDARERLRNDFTEGLKARDLLLHDTGDRTVVLQALLAFLAQSDAEVVLVNLEDVWGEAEPQNVPGVPERSWRQKLRMTLEQAASDNTVKRLLHAVDDKRRKVDGNT